MSTGKVILALLAGAASGVFAGVLLANHKGKKATREKTARNSEAFEAEVTEKITAYMDDISEKLGIAKEGVSEFTEPKLHKNGKPNKKAKMT